MTQANWRKDFAPKLQGQGIHGSQLRAVPHRRGFRRHADVNRGRKLFYAMNCYGCHKIDGMSEGTLGPDLTEAGKKFKIDYLWESIVEPRANLATSFMPKFDLSEADVRVAGDFPEEPARGEFRRDLARPVQGARGERRRW